MFPVVRIDDVAEFIRNGASIRQADGDTGVPITRIETISNREIDYDKFGYAGIQVGDYADYYLKDGDILISHINSEKHLGKCAIYKDRGLSIIHGMNLLCLRLIHEKMYSRFLFHALSSKSFLQQIPRITKKSVNQASFTVTNFKELEIPLPPLPEQKRIAAILDKADILRRKRQQAITLADEFLRAVFLDMFGDPVTNPKGWVRKSLSDVVKEGTSITYGIVQAGPEYDGGVPYIRTGDFKNGFLADDGYAKTDPAIAMNFERSKISEGDLVFCIRASVGAVDIVPNFLDGANLTQGTAKISPSKLILAGFLVEYLRTQGFQFWLSRNIKGATFKEITLGRLREAPVFLPPMNLQVKFLLIREKLTENILTRMNHSEKPLFDSLSQKAFKGELSQQDVA